MAFEVGKMINIPVDEITGIDVKQFVIRYLYLQNKETDTSELYRAWQDLCMKLGKKCVKKTSFRSAMTTMKNEGIIETNREEETGGGAFPKGYYVLTPVYYDYAKTEAMKKS